ncbi:transcription-repair coupling factor [Elioraea thermophila]|uniref:transcription-repair coupling factor n=1 Tax=Elioraea thermophila TaxID=2185104 RepID=UPI000DF3FD4E|nr:transcription-repair coupling factor [Elioraea thermophila]
MAERRIVLAGAPDGFDAALIARARAEHAGSLLHVCRDDARMSRLAEALAFFAPEAEVLQFPAWDCLPYDRVGPNPEITARRIDTLTRLLVPPAAPRIVLTTVNALVQRVPAPEVFRDAVLTVTKGARLPLDRIVAFLEANGYGRANTVIEPGEYAVRGGLIDLFPAGREEPVRIDLFGDEVEEIRSFDPLSQRSTGVLPRVDLKPVSEVFLDDASVARFRTAYRELFGAAADDPLYEAVSARRRFQGMEHWLPIFHEHLATLLDYLPDCRVGLDHEAEAVLETRLEMIADHYAARRNPDLRRLSEGELPYNPLPPERLYLDRAGWEAMLERAQVVQFAPFAKPEGSGPEVVEGGGRPGRQFAEVRARGENVFDALAEHADALIGQGHRVIVAAWTPGSRERLRALLAEHGAATAEPVETFAQAQALPRGVIALAVLGLERGFLAPGLAVIAEQDILGERISRPPKRRKRADQFIAEATELAEGDLVVHADHGIGRYEGLVTLEVQGAAHDCLKIVYDGGDKLFVPVENIEVLSRYGEGEGVALDKLGSTSWQNRKARMKARIRDMAAELLKVAAARRLKDAPTLLPPEGLWDEFCARFPYAETEDQARAIADVLEDFASGRPMDRLICGDVGFGKTEVALRAAFVAAMSGVQVAVVVPTTLLARQHYRTFADRFRGFPVRVAQLSRLVSAKEASEVKRGLADGSVNIVVGTHALLAKGIEFADLGLLIIDEEQHFGVAHKERLKQLRAEVHVLTLTATPIPRTLQLALTGVREMSLIATPPVDRLAVRTFILPFDPVVLREALMRERFRGGQVFWVVPRIEDLPKVRERIAELAPELKVVEAHGRLAASELERVMTAFQDGQYDVLLSTNIIESGLDLPAVNTIVIHRADMFGLAQLYQLRGRVGRGKLRGYAYLTIPADRKLTPTAQKRLEVMQALDTLGAGFTLASHDLDLRGAGNLLGEEQSGHIREVGIELYQQMLEEAVAELKSGEGRAAESDRDWTPQINLGLPVLIPESYVRDLPVRLGLYRRIGALASDAESEALAAELVDRFGPLPVEVENLLAVMGIKRLCREAGVEKLDAGPKGLVIQFRGNTFRDPVGLVGWIQKQAGLAKLRPDHRLFVARDLTDVSARVRLAREVLGALAAMGVRAKAA